MLMRLTIAFATVALLLAGVGLYGVLARQVEERRQEFGVRLALGARPSRVARLVTSDAVRALAVGLAIGMLSAAWLVRLIANRLFGVTGRTPSRSSARFSARHCHDDGRDRAGGAARRTGRSGGRPEALKGGRDRCRVSRTRACWASWNNS